MNCNTKLDWNEYFMAIAHIVSCRSVCERRRVGAVVTSTDNRILSTGYNGSARGHNNCPGVKICTKGRGHGCEYTQHAESNAIVYADRSLTKGGSIYTTLAPCPNCAQMIVNSGLKHVYYNSMKDKFLEKDYYYGSDIFEFFEGHSITLERIYVSNDFFDKMKILNVCRGVPTP